MTGPMDKRRFPRRTINTAVGLFGHGDFTFGQTRDIGEGGMMFSTEQALSPGDTLELHFHIPGKGFVSTVGEVLYINGKAVGIKFLKVDDNGLAFIRDFTAEDGN